MSIVEALDEKLKEGLKSGDKILVSTLRLLKAEIKNREIKKIKKLSDEEVYEAINYLAKQRRESIEIYKKAGRNDLYEKEEKELEFLSLLLPKQLTIDEIKAIIDKAVKETGAESAKDIGKVMKTVMPQTTGRADGKLVNELVREALK